MISNFMKNKNQFIILQEQLQTKQNPLTAMELFPLVGAERGVRMGNSSKSQSISRETLPEAQ